MKLTRICKMFYISSIVVVGLIITACNAEGRAHEDDVAILEPYVEANSTRLISENERICLAFIKKGLLSSEGIRTNYLDQAHNPDYATGKEVLSESQGLLMLYAAKNGDKSLFDRAYECVNETLDNEQLISYRYIPSEDRVYAINAAIDDLRIIKGLLVAGEQFENEGYTQAAIKLAERFWQTNVKDHLLYDFYDSELGISNNFTTLCYSDFQTMNLLGEGSSKWNKLSKKMLEVIKGGYISDTFPLFYPRYSYESKTYDGVGEINMIEGILTAYHLAEVGECPSSTIAYIKQKLGEGGIYTHYTLEGIPTTDIQSTAIYALCAQLGAVTGDDELYRQSLEYMNELQVRDTTSPIYGGFGNPDTLEAFSFDNLMALMAYCLGESYE